MHGADDADCNGYSCVDGRCCGHVGQFSGVVDCCPDSGVECSYAPYIFNTRCCRPQGGACTMPAECCSGTCLDDVCH